MRCGFGAKYLPASARNQNMQNAPLGRQARGPCSSRVLIRAMPRNTKGDWMPVFGPASLMPDPRLRFQRRKCAKQRFEQLGATLAERPGSCRSNRPRLWKGWKKRRPGTGAKIASPTEQDPNRLLTGFFNRSEPGLAPLSKCLAAPAVQRRRNAGGNSKVNSCPPGLQPGRLEPGGRSWVSAGAAPVHKLQLAVRLSGFQ